MPVNPIWRHHDYMLLWSGRTVSALGSSMSGIAFPLVILALTHSPALAGLAGGLRAVPYVLLSLPAGALVDRWDPKRVMILCDAGRALTLGSIPVAWWTGHLSLVQLYAATTLEGTLFVLYNIANLSALPRLVPRERLAAAAAQDEGAYYAVGLLGPAAGGLLYQVAAVLPFLTDAVSYLLSVLSLLLITADLRPHTAGRSRDLRTDLLAGPAWLWHEPLIRSLSLLDGAEALVASGSTLVVIVLAKQHHAAPATIGAIFSVAGGGGVLGALLGAHVQARLGFGRTVIGVRWASAMLWPLYAIAPNALFLGMITAGIYVLNPIKNVAHVSYALPLIPEELRGRVTGLWDLIPSATAFAGVTLTGLALQSSGPRATVGVASVIVLMLALAITLNSHVRNAPAPAAARPPE